MLHFRIIPEKIAFCIYIYHRLRDLVETNVVRNFSPIFDLSSTFYAYFDTLNPQIDLF
jgi:hypothetical protein